jgi:hypothetical protein
MEPQTWIKWRTQQFLWDEGKMPWLNPEMHRQLEEMLVGAGIRTLPILADALPLLVNEDSVKNFAEAAELLSRRSLLLAAKSTGPRNSLLGSDTARSQGFLYE